MDATNTPIDGYGEPINFSATDKFCLDGQRLLSELDASGVAVNNVYRLELDAFTRVTAVFDATPANGPRAFKVQRRDGTTAWYGDFDGCQLSGNLCSAVRSAANRTDALILANTLDTSGNTILRAQASAWAMNRSYDSNGNYVDFMFSTDALKGEFVLAQVNFTGFAVFPGVTGVPSAPYASVVMNYSTLPPSGQRSGYNFGSRFVRSKRLDSIDSKVGAVLVRHYKMAYAPAASGSGDDVLVQFTECRDNSALVCLKPTVFLWSQGQTTFSTQHVTSQSGFGKFVDAKFGDVNGDGRVEMVWVRNSASSGCPSSEIVIAKAYKNASGQLEISPPQSPICTGWDSNDGITGVARYWQLLDYNGDGLDDLMLAQKDVPAAKWLVYPATPTNGFSLATAIVTNIPVYRPVVNATDLGTLQLGDFNGDGLLDVLNIENSARVGNLAQAETINICAPLTPMAGSKNIRRVPQRGQLALIPLPELGVLVMAQLARAGFMATIN